MILKTPCFVQFSNVQCDIRGFHVCSGDVVKPGDYLAELRYEVLDDKYSDCPIVYYGDLVAAGGGVVRRVEDHRSGPMGMILGEIGDEEGDFPVRFVVL